MPCRIAMGVSSVTSKRTVNADVMRTFSHVFTLKFRFFIAEFIMPVTPSVKIIMAAYMKSFIYSLRFFGRTEIRPPDCYLLMRG